MRGQVHGREEIPSETKGDKEILAQSNEGMEVEPPIRVKTSQA